MTFAKTKTFFRSVCLIGLVCSPWFQTLANAQDPAITQTSRSWNSGSWNSSGWTGGSWGNSNWPGTTTTNRSWTLGVTGRNTEIGVMIDSVTPGSSAARAGLSVGDLIVCVNGNQIGTVGSRIFEIGQSLNQHADAVGNVMLLVQGSRTGQLRTIMARLDNQQAGLSGSLIVQGGTVPPNSIVTVQLVNLTRPFFVVRNGLQTFRSPTISQGSIPFMIDFDPSYISASDRYGVSASIAYNNVTMFESTQPTFVLTQGNPSTAQLILSPKSFPFGGQQPNNNVVTASYGYDSVSTKINAAYQKYLGRNATAMELAAWQSVPDVEYRMGRLPFELMAAQEYFDRCGNNNVAWLERVFNEVIGHAPTSYEQQLWMARYAEVGYSRTEVLRQMSMVTGRK